MTADHKHNYMQVDSGAFRCIICGRFRTGPDRRTLEQRFWDKVEKQSGDNCWLWIGAIDGRGYGVLYWENRHLQRTHRIAWFLQHQRWPTLHVCHHCDVRRCIRYDHLFEGTQKENIQDMIRKDRRVMVSLPGVINPNARLREDDVREIRRLYADGQGTQREIGAKFGVSDVQVSNIVHFRPGGWPHIK